MQVPVFKRKKQLEIKYPQKVCTLLGGTPQISGFFFYNEAIFFLLANSASDGSCVIKLPVLMSPEGS
jgi:hypothetical protein